MLPLLLNKAFSTWTQRRRQAAGPGTGRRAKTVNLALQGGGAHGAFTWGVIDQLLADGRLAIDGISGTSAGAVNAVVLADGLARGGPDFASARLAEFWRAASFGGGLPELQRAVVERMFSFVPRGGHWLASMPRLWSPYDLNPLNINPLKDLIARFVDFDLIRSAPRELFVAATNVRTGEQRVFTRADISAEAVMASACLPTLFRAVEIDGMPYWDGGYSGNPVLTPFLRATSSEDVLIVQINPIERPRLPVSAREIVDRTQEIAFNASLLAELREVALVTDLIDAGALPRGTGGSQYRRMRLHRIVMEDFGAGFAHPSKLNTDYEFFETLRKLGRRAARRFLDAHYGDIGRRDTIHDTLEEAAEVA